MEKKKVKINEQIEADKVTIEEQLPEIEVYKKKYDHVSRLKKEKEIKIKLQEE